MTFQKTSALSIRRLFAFPAFVFLLGGYLEDQGLMSSCISFGFLCGNPCRLFSCACFPLPIPCPSPCHEEMERKLTAHLLFKTWISERRSLDVTKRVFAKSGP